MLNEQHLKISGFCKGVVVGSMSGKVWVCVRAPFPFLKAWTRYCTVTGRHRSADPVGIERRAPVCDKSSVALIQSEQWLGPVTALKLTNVSLSCMERDVKAFCVFACVYITANVKTAREK